MRDEHLTNSKSGSETVIERSIEHYGPLLGSVPKLVFGLVFGLFFSIRELLFLDDYALAVPSTFHGGQRPRFSNCKGLFDVFLGRICCWRAPTTGYTTLTRRGGPPPSDTDKRVRRI